MANGEEGGGVVVACQGGGSHSAFWDLGLEWMRVIGEVAAPEVSPYRLAPGAIDPNADPAFAEPLDAESNLERSRAFLSDPIAHGRHQGRAFVDRLEQRDDDADRETALEGRDIWGRWIKDLPACR